MLCLTAHRLATILIMPLWALQVPPLFLPHHDVRPNLILIAWSGGFPVGVPNITQLPQPWVDALNAAVAAGKIPNIPISSNKPNTNPVYPQGFNPNGAQVCSATYGCRSPGDIWAAPVGVFASAFDDGPLPVSCMLAL